MAKTAALKSKNAPSKHSRAAKRASSPSINTDKSLKEVKPPVELKQPVLGAHTGSGVKKSKGRKAVLSSKARKRQEKHMDRAEAVMNRTEKKVEKSKGRAKNIQERSKAWDDLNKRVLAKKAKEEQEENWENVEESEKQVEIHTGDDEIKMGDLSEATPIDAAIPADNIEDEDLVL